MISNVQANSSWSIHACGSLNKPLECILLCNRISCEADLQKPSCVLEVDHAHFCAAGQNILTLLPCACFRRQAGSSGKRRAEALGDPGGSSGKRARRDAAAHDETLAEEDDIEEGPSSGRQSPDENAQPGNAAAKQRVAQKPAGEASALILAWGITWSIGQHSCTSLSTAVSSLILLNRFLLDSSAFCTCAPAYIYTYMATLHGNDETIKPSVYVPPIIVQEWFISCFQHSRASPGESLWLQQARRWLVRQKGRLAAGKGPQRRQRGRQRNHMLVGSLCSTLLVFLPIWRHTHKSERRRLQ